MEGLDRDYANKMGSWILAEARKLSMQPPAFQEKTYDIVDISKKEGPTKCLAHAVEFARICPEIFAVSKDLTRVRVRAPKSTSNLFTIIKLK